MRVWFNRTYATTSHLFDQLRANPDGRRVHVIASHSDPDSPVLATADQAAEEPTVDGDGYVEWAWRFAREHRVDVLVPRHQMAELADARSHFAAEGTAIACPDGDTIRLFEDKAAAYIAAAELGVAVPPHRVVTDGAALQTAYAEFNALGSSGVCVKPVTGVGGEGYRRLTHLPSTAAEYTGEVRSTVRVDAVAAAWDRDGGPPSPVLVMPFLDGAEVSVDVLATADGEVLAAVGRRHDESRRREIVDDPIARAIAHRLTTTHRIGYLSNTQVRYWQGPDDESPKPYLLEVNTRAAGGLFQTALAGVNLPWAAVLLAAGEPVTPLRPVFGASYVQIAAMVALQRGD